MSDPNEDADALASLYEQTDGVDVGPVSFASIHADIDPVEGMPHLPIVIGGVALLLLAVAVATVNPFAGGWLALSVVSAVAFGLAGRWLGAMRGHSVAGFWFGALLGPIGLVITCLMPDQREP